MINFTTFRTKNILTRVIAINILYNIFFRTFAILSINVHDCPAFYTLELNKSFKVEESLR